MKRIDFFFDYSCPYAYLAHTQIERIAATAKAELAWRPMLLGGVFNALNHAPQNMAAPKAALNGLDMLRWADALGVPLHVPETHPMRTVTALRATLATTNEADKIKAAKALFRAYWVRGADVSKPEVVASTLTNAGLDGDALVKRAEEASIKDLLRQETDAAIAAGAFGAPTFVVTNEGSDPELIWGQDRFDHVLAALGADREPPPPPATEPNQTIDFYFDLSSPYAFLASTQIGAIAARHRANVNYKPFLLGALFKDIGTPMVPLLAMPEAKRRFAGKDLYRWASLYKVPFNFPSRFPMNSVKGLRMILQLANDKRPALVDALYRAYWVDDQDLADDATLAKIAGANGFDGDALVKGTQDDAIKEALKRATNEARERGLCGAPSFDVHGFLFWGQDRLPFVERVLGGWRPACG